MYELTVRRSEISASPMKNIMGTTSQEVKVTEQTREKVNIQIGFKKIVAAYQLEDSE